MTSFVVLAVGSMCGPITIKAQSPNEAAQLYRESCGGDDVDSIWVWKTEDYHNDPNQRPEPLEFDFRNTASI